LKTEKDQFVFFLLMDPNQDITDNLQHNNDTTTTQQILNWLLLHLTTNMILALAPEF
jgi:hypothetical protein